MVRAPTPAAADPSVALIPRMMRTPGTLSTTPGEMRLSFRLGGKRVRPSLSGGSSIEIWLI
eukprot:7379778-Prymnesium_polylepis.1